LHEFPPCQLPLPLPRSLRLVLPKLPNSTLYPKSPARPSRMHLQHLTRTTNQCFHKKMTYVYTCNLKSGDVIALFRSQKQDAPFLNPFKQYIRTYVNSETFKKKISVDFFHFERDETYPFEYKEDHRKKPPAMLFSQKQKTGAQAQPSGMNPRYLVLGRFWPPTEPNTPATRKAWGKRLLLLNNHARIQQDYQFGGNSMEFGGDITPNKEAEIPPLSRFLTLTDTLLVLSHAFPKEDDTSCRYEDILGQDDILNDYYQPAEIPLIREHFNFNIGEHIEEGQEFAFLPDFNPGANQMP